MRIAVAVAAVAAVSVHSAAAQERGWLAIGTDPASNAFSFRSADDAVDFCGFQDCEVLPEKNCADRGTNERHGLSRWTPR